MLFMAAGAQGALAQPYPPLHEDDDEHDQEVVERAKNRLNMRLGTASTDRNGRPTICMEVRAVAQLSIEGCGTGTGFLHQESGGELAHFRAKWGVYQRVVSRGLLRAQVGLGFAELQLDADEPGFVIDPGENGVEASGPEGSVSVQWLRPISRGWEFIMNTSVGTAWIPGAGDLSVPQDTVQPYVSFEIGVGW